MSFELDDVLYEASAVRDGVRGELQPWLASRLSAAPPDAQAMMDAVRAAGAEFGMMMPGDFLWINCSVQARRTALAPLTRGDLVP